MIPEIREGILAAEGAANDPAEDFNGDISDNHKQQSRRDYNIGVLKHVQVIFGHLALDRLQFFIPCGFWRHFKLFGEPVNLREQHDALEFYNSLVDSLDEALKSLNFKPLMTETLGGTFADQKICLGCPHRYSREESFTTLNIDIRNHNNLLESLEQYVKGDLLEGANAYHCEKCNRKVDTMKRLCIQKLPCILAIQLKRFDYDWERETAIKFNDYFEFPPVLDMHPYTAEGLAEAENDQSDSIELSASAEQNNEEKQVRNTQFELSGIVVHSGQASGGHYYSYISVPNTGELTEEAIEEQLDNRWYKFDDGDVSESQLHLSQEMRAQCFGGDYSTDSFDSGPLIGPKRSVRKQKRWWSAYILFYRRKDAVRPTSNQSPLELLPFLPKEKQPKMPIAIRRSVQMQNSRYLHISSQFSPEYFTFVRQLTLQTAELVKQENGSQLAFYCVQLLSRFLFGGGLRARKCIRGCAIEWSEIFAAHLKANQASRVWLIQLLLQQKPTLITEYLIDCPSADVRQAFGRLLALLAQLLFQEQPPHDLFVDQPEVISNHSLQLSNRLLKQLMLLLRRLLTESNRSYTQLVVLFNDYALFGPNERAQLIHLKLPMTLLSVILDDVSSSKQLQNETPRLFQLLFLLLRSCDLSPYCKKADATAVENNNPFTLPIHSLGLVPLDPQLPGIFSRNVFIKRLVEECSGPASEECIKIIRLLSWENLQFSLLIIVEIIWHLNSTYESEHFKAQLHLLRCVLMLNDSWSAIRLHKALIGVQDKSGLFDFINRSRNQHPRQVSQCIECLIDVMNSNSNASQLFRSDPALREQWAAVVSFIIEQYEQTDVNTSNATHFANESDLQRRKMILYRYHALINEDHGKMSKNSLLLIEQQLGSNVVNSNPQSNDNLSSTKELLVSNNVPYPLSSNEDSEGASSTRSSGSSPGAQTPNHFGWSEMNDDLEAVPALLGREALPGDTYSDEEELIVSTQHSGTSNPPAPSTHPSSSSPDVI
jgi:ubiquitin carboxyl-terminal hydrolase 9/24